MPYFNTKLLEIDNNIVLDNDLVSHVQTFQHNRSSYFIVLYGMYM